MQNKSQLKVSQLVLVPLKLTAPRVSSRELPTPGGVTAWENEARTGDAAMTSVSCRGSSVKSSGSLCFKSKVSTHGARCRTAALAKPLWPDNRSRIPAPDCSASSRLRNIFRSQANWLPLNCNSWATRSASGPTPLPEESCLWVAKVASPLSNVCGDATEVASPLSSVWGDATEVTSPLSSVSSGFLCSSNCSSLAPGFTLRLLTLRNCRISALTSLLLLKSTPAHPHQGVHWSDLDEPRSLSASHLDLDSQTFLPWPLLTKLLQPDWALWLLLI